MTTETKTTEADIQRQIKEYLQWHGWFVVKIHQSLGSYKGSNERAGVGLMQAQKIHGLKW